MTRRAILPVFALAACQPASEPDSNASAAADVSGDPDSPVSSSPMPDSGPANNPLAVPPDMGADPAADADEDACGTAKVTRYIGQEASVPVRSAVVRESGATSARWLYPDSMVTEDYSPQRLNVMLDKTTDRIVSMRCG